MAITDEDVKHVARLARLRLTAEETRLYRGQLERILEYMAQLDELDTVAVPPTAHVLGLRNVLREDEARPSVHREGFLENAPASEGPYLKVPKVIE
ncbi:MAG: Asp-tRNA(Asn)/Glu-tRNA(Gln) amidotransferase subunit GatC [Elusimicrobiota bacterium]